MDPGTSFTVLVLLFTLLVIATYFLPTIVATIRNHPNALPICLLNFFLGWTLLGWIGALIWSAHSIHNGRGVGS